MLDHLIHGAQAWRGDSLESTDALYFQLSEHFVAAAEETVSRLNSDTRPTTELVVAATPLAECRADLEFARMELESGRGYVVIRGLTTDHFSRDQLVRLYWLVGQLLGRPFPQNVQGTLLYDVRDTGQDVRYGARFSVTNAESTFHTDNSFGAQVLDYVGLLCLCTARSGGLSQMVSGYAAHNELLASHPSELALLYKAFHVDRRGGVLPNESQTVQVPILCWDGCELLCRYLRFWIEAGHDKIGQPLATADRNALDCFDAVLADPRLRLEFALQPGDIYFINNRWILHNRTAFEDHADEYERRHLVRLWLQCDETEKKPNERGR